MELFKKYIKAILFEVLVTLSSIGTVIFTALKNIDHWTMWFVVMSAFFTIIYMIWRISKSIKDIREKRKFELLVDGNLDRIMESIKSYIALIAINSDEKIQLYGKDITQYKNAAKHISNVDFRIEDPYTGTSMGNLAEQVSFGMNSINKELDSLIYGYGHKMNFKTYELYDKLKRNFVYSHLVKFNLYYDQMMTFQKYARRNPTFPENGTPINFGFDQEEFIAGYEEMLDIIFELQRTESK